MSTIRKLLCWLGLHDWSEWDRDGEEGHFERETRTCACGATEIRNRKEPRRAACFWSPVALSSGWYETECEHLEPAPVPDVCPSCRRRTETR